MIADETLNANAVDLTTTEVKIVKQMPAQAAGKKPTVAIITSRYYEKLAVDAMMEDKTTFVKYKTEGMDSISKPLCV